MAGKDEWSDRGGLFGRGLLVEGDEPGTYKSAPAKSAEEERMEFLKWMRDSPSAQKHIADGNKNFIQWANEKAKPVVPQEFPMTKLYRQSQAENKAMEPYREAIVRSKLDNGKQVALAPEMQSFLSKQEPSVDWGKVKVRQGHNIPGSEAWTVHDQISLKDPPTNPPGSARFEDLIFHEVSHVPQWKSGRLTFLRYIAEALGAAASYAGEAASTYGMHPARKTPPTKDIWDRIPIEKEAVKRAKQLKEQYQKTYPDSQSRKILK
jgi:hypothetical protein